jgi:hypothetical protein
MTTEYKTLDDKIKLLKTFIGAVCNNLRVNDEELLKTNSSGGPEYEKFKNIMLRANFKIVSDDGKLNLAREAMICWKPEMSQVQMLDDYVSLLKSIIALLYDESTDNDVWIYRHQATQVVTRKQGSNFANVNTPVTVRNSGTVELLLNRIHELLE